MLLVRGVMDNIISTVLSLLAFLFSVFTFIYNIRVSKFKILYDIYEGNEGIQKKSGAVYLAANESRNHVDICRPNTEINFHICNRGNQIAVNPIMVFSFSDVEIENEFVDELEAIFEKVEMRDHEHGLGYYRTYECSFGEKYKLIPDIPVNLPIISLSGLSLGDCAEMDVSLAAENSKTKKINIKLKYL